MHSIWAVAGNTIAQALRMKVALVTIILLVILLPLMSVIMEGDGTLHGKLQTFISYGLSLTSMLLCMLTIAISTYTLTSDLVGRQIYLVATKPIRRFEILIGKLIGIVLLDVFLLVIFSGIIYGLTVAIPWIDKPSPEEKAVINNEFFTARKSLVSAVNEEQIAALAEQAYEKLKKAGQLPENMPYGQVIAELRGRERMKARAVEVGSEKVWEFENVRLHDPSGALYIRFKYDVSVEPPDSKVYAIWIVGDYRQVQQSGPGQWKSPVYTTSRADVTRAFRELEIPGDAVAQDGYLAVVFRNVYDNSTTVIPEDVEVLYRVSTFAANYTRSILLLLTRLIFLAALGVSLSTWLSFPVAILVCIVVFFIGTINGFVLDSFTYLSTGTGIIYKLTLEPLLWFLPQFDGRYNPAQYMISGRLLNWLLVGQVFLFTVVVKSAAILFLGFWIFSNRELAKTSA